MFLNKIIKYVLLLGHVVVHFVVSCGPNSSNFSFPCFEILRFFSFHSLAYSCIFFLFLCFAILRSKHALTWTRGWITSLGVIGERGFTIVRLKQSIISSIDLDHYPGLHGFSCELKQDQGKIDWYLPLTSSCQHVHRLPLME